MCGVTGIYAFNMVGRVNMINLATATEKLAHRGPDFQNGYNDQNVGLGHRRLSVIDTSPAGHQPMCDFSERYWIAFNGEVYNFKELRSDLEKSGVTFVSHSDTEVVLQLLIRDGKDALNKLNGFFSFAFYDRESADLLLAVDRFGIKPMCYYHDQDKFLFSSELRSLAQYGMEKEINYEALLYYLQLNYVPGPLTMIKGVSKLMPGHLVSINNNAVHVEQWYKPENTVSDSSYLDAQAEVHNKLEESVSRRLVSDVPLGSFLSGGLDSSIISMLAVRQKPDLNTFSVGFPEERFFDESDYSDLVANHIHSNHHKFDLTRKKFEESAEDILNQFDEPFADSSAIAYYLLSKETRMHSTVALSGDGADEIFAGYNKHQAYSRINSSPLTNLAVMGLSPLSYLFPSSRNGKLGNTIRQVQRYASAAVRTNKERYWFLASLTSYNMARKWLNPSIVQNITGFDEFGIKNSYLKELDTHEGLNGFLRVDQQLVLPWDMLVKSDRMSMAHGLEVRVPFMDHELVEYVNSLPAEYKIQGASRKRILYDAFRSDLPEQLYHRPKKGFEVPLHNWLNKSSIKYELAKLTDEQFIKDQGIFDPRQVRKVMKSLKSNSPSDSHARAWAIFVFQWWWRKEFM